MAVVVYGSARFYLQIGNDKVAVFTELSGLSLETEVYEYHEGGQNDHPHRLPGRSKIGNLVFKRGITKNNKFFDWCLNMTRGKIEKQNLTVTLFDSDGTVAMTWEFANAFPVKWSGPTFNADSKDIAIESLELAHDGFTA
jgi:phage tail-like protein